MIYESVLSLSLGGILYNHRILENKFLPTARKNIGPESMHDVMNAASRNRNSLSVASGCFHISKLKYNIHGDYRRKNLKNKYQ